MFSKEISDLLKGDELEVLKILAKHNPEQFKQNVHSANEDKNSFFISFFKSNDSLTHAKELLNLCESFGYDFAEQKRPYSEDDSYRLYYRDYGNGNKPYINEASVPKIQVEPEFTPEYIVALSYARSDETFSFLTEKMGKEKMLELEQIGWPILEYAYRKNFTKTIQLLCDYGFNYDKTPSGVSLLSIAANDHHLIDLFWKIKNKNEQVSDSVMNDEQFKHFFKTTQQTAKKIQGKKDYLTDHLLQVLDQKKDILTLKQKEQLLISFLPVSDPRLYKGMAKMMGMKLSGEEFKKLILPHLEKSASHDLLYFVAEEKKYLFHKVEESLITKNLENGNVLAEQNPLKNIYGVDVFINKLADSGIRPLYDYESDKKKALINRAFQERLEKLFSDQTIFFEKFDNGLTLFEKIATTKFASNPLLAFLDIRPKTSSEKETSFFKCLDVVSFQDVKAGDKSFTDEQKAEIRDVLEKTWLIKNKNGVSLFKRVGIDTLSEKSFWILNDTLLNTKGIYTNEEKMDMLNDLVNKKAVRSYDSKIFKDIKGWDQDLPTDSLDIKLTKKLYVMLRDDPESKWKDFKLTENALKGLENSEFLFELKARQLTETLNEDLHRNKEATVKKMKI